MSHRFFQGLKWLFLSKWSLLCLGFLALSFLIWFGLPLIAIAGQELFVSTWVRFSLIVGLLLCLLLQQAIQFVRRQKAQQQHLQQLLAQHEQLQAQAETQAKTQSQNQNQEQQTQTQTIQNDLEVLKQTMIALRQRDQQQPWYLILGAEKSGKTSVLQQAGLVLNDTGNTQTSEQAQHLEFYSSKQAVLVDCAGRCVAPQFFHSPHSIQAKQVNSIWFALLGFLKKYRPNRPINGIIVTVSLTDLIEQNAVERQAQARAIAQRLQELQNQLQLHFPVYVLLTKADLIAGFKEYFAELNAEQSQQIWGVTFREQESVAQFNQGFYQLLQQVQQGLNHRLFQETDLNQRALIYEFPKQLYLLQPILDDFLKEVFASTAFTHSTQLRGAYLVSSAQTGQSIDQVMKQIGAGLGLSAVPSLQVKHQLPPSYFLKQLFPQLILPEQHLATHNQRHQQQRQWQRRLLLGSCSLVLCTLSYFWYHSYQWNQGLTDRVQLAIAEYQQASSSNPTAQTDVLRLVERLDLLRQLPVGFAEQAVGSQSLPVVQLGLSQSEKLAQPAKEAYLKALQGYLAPYLHQLLLETLATQTSHLEYLYETLKVYLMLHQPEHFQLEVVQAWFQAYFERHLSGEVNRQSRAHLQFHLQTLFAYQLDDVPINHRAVEEARALLTQIPLPERAYQRLKLEFSQSRVADFQLADVLGRAGRQAFMRRSGKPLTERISGLYTYHGFHTLFQVENARIVSRLMEDNWVYGDQHTHLSQAILNQAMSNETQIREAVATLYYQDYIDQWRALIEDIELKPYHSPTEGAAFIQQLMGAERPVTSLIQHLQKQLRLTEVMPNEVLTRQGVDSQVAQLNRFLPAEMNLTVKLAGAEVEQAFAEILSVSETQLAQIDQALIETQQSLQLLAEESSKAPSFSNRQINAQTSLQTNLQLGAQANSHPEQIATQFAQTLPNPFARWISGLSQQSNELTTQATSQYLNAQWQAQVYQPYLKSIRGRYPFNKQATKEVTLTDFNRFFGYGGVMDQFFTQHLKPHVDTSQRTWRFKRDLGLAPTSLRAFQKAAQIRQMFFAPNAATSLVEFTLTPRSLAAHIHTFNFALGEQQLSYSHGPIRAQSFHWPIKTAEQLRYAFVPPQSGHAIAQAHQGVWGLFRWLDQLQAERPATAEDHQLQIQLKGNQVELAFAPASATHPFWSNELVRFGCPAKL